MGNIFETIFDVASLSSGSILEDLIRRPFSSFYRIETAIDERTLVSSEGAMATILRLDGTLSETSLKSNAETVEALLSKISAGFSQSGHAVEFFFALDPDRSRNEIGRQIAIAKGAAKRLGLDIEDLLEERVSWLSKFVFWETACFVIWTRPGAVNKDELKIARERAIAARKNAPRPKSGSSPAQDYMTGYPIVLQKHKGFVDMFTQAFSSVGLRIETMKVHTAIAYQRDAIYPGSVDVNRLERYENGGKSLSESGTWRPFLPGDAIPPRLRLGKSSEADLFWPNLPRQIFRSGVEFDDENPRFPIVEDRIYAPVDIDLPPEKIPIGGFQDLLNSIVSSTDETGQHMPFRVRYLIETAGMFRLGFKQIAAQIGAAFSDSNKRINEAIKYLKTVVSTSDPDLVDKAVSIRISACTWAPRGQLDLLRSREAALKSAFEQWGGCQVTTAIGD
ncbi:MAG: hypothetical protein ING19_15725, partial [Azospirillum sp.]|nr:hypothetical protein [Azospirillum sp.]